MDKYSEERLDGLHPALAERFTMLDELLESRGIVLRITQGLRTMGQQEALYRQGRDASFPGPVVTNAKPGHSWHQYGTAIDVVIIRADGTLNWDVTSPEWQQVFDSADSVNLFAGRNFVSIPGDNDHFQLRELPESPAAEDVADLTAGRLVDVWERYLPSVPPDSAVPGATPAP